MNDTERDIDAAGPQDKGSDEFRIYTELADFPVTEYPSYLRYAVGAVCISGSAVVRVFENECRIKPGIVITLIPWQLASVKKVSKDFRLLFYRASQEMFSDCVSSLWRQTLEFFTYMRCHIASTPDPDNIRRFRSFCNLLSYWSQHAPVPCRRESIMQLLRVHLWNVYALYVCDPRTPKVKYSRREELAFHFVRLIVEDHTPGRNVAHYATQLSISPKTLTNLIRSISGQSARDWIVYFIILEMKSLLRQSSMDLKSIAARMKFPDQTSMSRFFRRYTGMTPSGYRESIHF